MGILNSFRKSNRAFALGIFLLTASSAYAQPYAVRPDDYFARAMEFVRTFYRELPSGLGVIIYDLDRFHVSAAETPDSLHAFTLELAKGPVLPDDVCCETVFRAFFVFNGHSRDRELYKMVTHGPWAEAKDEAFVQKVGKQTMSEEETAAAMKAAGARFGPDHKSEFVQALPLEALKRYIGNVKLVSVEYFGVSRGDGMEPGLPFWSVKLKAHGHGGKDTYSLDFEPFDGHLVSINRFSLP